MRYDFDNIPDRRGSGSYKWDEAPEGVLPLWVADMDFKAAPFILDALQKRLDHGVFGYTLVDDAYYDAVIDWFRRRRGWNIEREWIMYTPGVIPSLSSCIKAFTRPGDKVATLIPAYNNFFTSIRNNGCILVGSQLRRVEDSFEVNFDDLEQKLSDPEVKVFILCNPHNPSGRIWTASELERMGEICRKTDTIVISDEIHCEIEMPGNTFIPFAIASPSTPCVTLNSPTKNFNIAGLQISNIICPDPEWRRKIDRAVNDNEVCDVNPFGVTALKAAYTSEGEEWLKEMNEYIFENYTMLRDTFHEKLPHIPVCRLEGTYLAWIDCRACGKSTDDIQNELITKEKVWINGGAMYGDADYMRINLATSHSLFSQALAGIVRFFLSL